MTIAYKDDCVEQGLTTSGFADTQCKVDARGGQGVVLPCDSFLSDTLGHRVVPAGRTAGICTCYTVRRRSEVLTEHVGWCGSHVGVVSDQRARRRARRPRFRRR